MTCVIFLLIVAPKFANVYNFNIYNVDTDVFPSMFVKPHFVCVITADVGSNMAGIVIQPVHFLIRVVLNRKCFGDNISSLIPQETQTILLHFFFLRFCFFFSSHVICIMNIVGD